MYVLSVQDIWERLYRSDLSRILSSNPEDMEELNPPLLSCTLYLPTYRPLSLPTWLSGWLGLLSHRTARRWFVSQADELFAFRVLPQCVRLDRYLCLSLIPPHWKNSLTHTHTHTHTLTLVLFFCCFFFVLFCLNHSGLDSRPWRSPLILTTPVFLLRWGLRFRGLFFWCTVVTLSSLTAVLPSSSPKETATQTAIYCSKRSTALLLSLSVSAPSAPQTSSGFVLKKGVHLQCLVDVQHKDVVSEIAEESGVLRETQTRLKSNQMIAGRKYFVVDINTL